MPNIEKMDKKLEDLNRKLEVVQETIQSKKETEKKLLKEIQNIEAKRNNELFGDMSKAVKQEKIDLTPDDVQYMIAMLKERKEKAANASAEPKEDVKDNTDNVSATKNDASDDNNENDEANNSSKDESSNGDDEEPFPIKNPFNMG